MPKDIIINVNDKTKGISKQGFNLPLIFDHRHDFDYVEITSPDQLIYKEVDLDSKTKPELIDYIKSRGYDIDISMTVEELKAAIKKEIEKVNGLEAAGITPDDRIYKLVQKLKMRKPELQTIAVAGKNSTSAAELIEGLTEVVNTGKNDWLYLATTATDLKKIEAVAKWAQASDKFYGITSSNKDLGKQIESSRTWVGYHEDEEDMFAEGLITNFCMNEPGSITAKRQTVAGSKPSSIDRNKLDMMEKEMHTMGYIRDLGVNYVSNSQMSDGSYIDVNIGAHYLKSRLEEELFHLMVREGKISYDIRGITLVESVIKGVMREVAEMDIIYRDADGNPIYDMDVKQREDMPIDMVRNRKYNGISVAATVAGAIEDLEVNVDLVMEIVEEGDAA